MLTISQMIFGSNKLELLKNTFTQLVLLVFLTLISHQILADEFSPVVTITNPTTSNNIYVTENGTLNIAGSASDLSYIERVEWILFDLDIWEEIDYGEAVIENNVPFSATWYANNINLPYGMSDITVIAFDVHGNSDYDRLVVIRSEESLEELFDEDIAQADPSDSCGRQTGDPIDTATGAQFLRHTLLTVKGLVPISFSLEYNSLLTKEGTTGRGWGNSNYSTRLEELDNGDVKIHWTTNRYNIFTKQGNGQYESFHSACRFDRLVKNPDGHFILSRNNKMTYEFNLQGQLINRSNQNGQSLIFSYDGNGRLAMVEEPVSGVFLAYAYNSEGLLATITDPLGRQAKLEYDSNHLLTKMIDAAGQTITYTYNNLGQTLTAVNADGVQLFSNTYDDNHRIISQEDSVGNQIHLSYDTDNFITTVTNRIGGIKVYNFDNNNQLLSLKNELGHIETYTYDLNGKRTSVTDSNGNTTKFEYDTNGNLKTLIDAKQRKTQLTYNDDNHLLSVENALGKQIKFAYENNLLTSVTDPFNHTMHYTYNDYAQVLTKTSPKGGTVAHEYTNGLLTKVTNAENGVSILGYDLAGRLTTVTNINGHTTTLVYDEVDRLKKIINPLNHEVSMTYDSRNHLRTFTDANGNVTKRDYDNADRLISQTNALNEVTEYQYDDEGRLIQIVDALEQVTALGYDSAGRLVSVTNPLGHTQTLEYDAANNLLKWFDALGKRETLFKYDALNNPVKVTDALDNSNRFEYDELNRLVESVDPLNRVTQFDYDALNRLVSSVDALQGESKQSFDADGNPVSLTDPNSNTTQFEFDLNGNLVQETLATEDKVKYTYDARDLLKTVTNGRQQQRVFEYDVLGRLKSWTDPDGSVAYTYDNNGNVLTVTDSSGTITREYDKLNRVIKYTDVRGNVLQYAYDSVGNLVGLTYPDGKLVSYEYDAAGQLVKVTDWANRVTVYAYDKNGRLISLLRPNGTQMTRSYDAAGQLLRQDDVVSFEFSYDAAGNIIAEKTNLEADPNINLEMTYQAANRLATVADKVVKFDADGNMIFGPLNGKIEQFEFDSRNRLKKAGGTAYQYDAENQRIGVDDTRYVVNSMPVLSQVLVRTKGNGEVTYYVYGLGLIGEARAGNYFSYHFDYRGSTVALSDASGQVIEKFQYSPYGSLMYGDASKTPFLFNGMYGVMTDANNLYYMRARFYSPEIKRFINQDILLGDVFGGQSLNRFGYTENNPINRIDPEGKFWWWAVGIGAWIATEIVIPSFSQSEASFDSGQVIPSSLPEIVSVTAISGSKIFNRFFCKHVNGNAINEVNAINDVIDIGKYPYYSGNIYSDNLIDVYRGVSQYHPGLLDALQGIARPRGGLSSPARHNKGYTDSEFTSWTTNKKVAESYAIINGPGGVLLHKRVKPIDLIESPNQFKESEVLIKGIVKNANVSVCNICD